MSRRLRRFLPAWGVLLAVLLVGACAGDPEPAPSSRSLAATGPGGATPSSDSEAARVEAVTAGTRGPRVLTDLRYGPHALHTLDLYLPERAARAPMVAYIHGGEFFEGDKKDHAKKGRAFAEAGVVFASLNYRLSPAFTHPAHSEDVARALRWLWEEGPRYGGDPARLFLSGHSSGAHLSALVATDARFLEAVGRRPAQLAGVVLLDGAGYHIATRLRRASAHTKEKYTQAFGKEPAQWDAASPPLQVEPGEALPRFLIFYAGHFPSPRRQAQNLARVLERSGARVELRHIAERNHVTLEKRLGERKDRATELFLRFVLEPPTPVPDVAGVAGTAPP